MKASTLSHIAAVCSAVVCLSRGLAAQDDMPVTIVVNPGPFATVEEAAAGEAQVDWWDDNPRDDGACTECFAAVELRRFLAACIDRRENDIRLTEPGRLPKKGYVFMLGNRKSNPEITSFDASPASKSMPDTLGSFRIRMVPDGNRTICIIEGNDRAGTLYGVYAYLERLGIRFIGLGEQGTIYPTGNVDLPKELDLVDSPKFLTRGFWAWEDRGNEEFFLWMARNRMNFWTAAQSEIPFLKKLGLKLTEGGHIIQDYFLNPHAEYPYNHPAFNGDESKPPDPYARGSGEGDTNGDGTLDYFEAHPEWYGLRKGKRSNKTTELGGVNFCTSNNDATRELAKNLIKSLIDGRWRYVDIVNFWMSDGGSWCECENCKNAGSPTDRLLTLIHEVFVEIQNARRDGTLQRQVQLTTLAYIETLAPPTRYHGTTGPAPGISTTCIRRPGSGARGRLTNGCSRGCCGIPTPTRTHSSTTTFGCTIPQPPRAPGRSTATSKKLPRTSNRSNTVCRATRCEACCQDGARTFSRSTTCTTSRIIPHETTDPTWSR